MTSPTTTITPPGPAAPERKKGALRRHPWRTFFGTVAVLVIAGSAASAAAGGGSSPAPASKPAASAPAAPAPSSAPAAAQQPVTGQGSSDVSLSDSLYGQDYLTASVQLHNPNPSAVAVHVKVSWPIQGFAPVTKGKTVTVPANGDKTVQLHYAATSQQISGFQDEQLASTSNDPSSYSITPAG